MPESAIRAGCVDLVLPPGEIARELVRLGHLPYARRTAVPDADPLMAGAADAPKGPCGRSQMGVRLGSLFDGTDLVGNFAKSRGQELMPCDQRFRRTQRKLRPGVAPNNPEGAVLRDPAEEARGSGLSFK
jgi:hypothetical protein